MTYKELMMQALTDMLKEGETLKHPIYGILQDGTEQFYAYFGFAGNDLLIAILVGKSVADTIRVPLDIRSLKIKQGLILKQYTIDISFNEGSPCRITASPRVMTIDTQKDNLPLFLEYLKSKTPKLETKELKDVEGKKLRRQYFNGFIYATLSFLPMVMILVIGIGLKRGEMTLDGFWVVMYTSIFMWGAVLLPFAVLSLLNKRFFGKVMCVLTKSGLMLENDLIAWEDIKEIVYRPRIGSRYKVESNSATIFVDPKDKGAYTVDVTGFPLYGLKQIKKYAPRVKTSIDKHGKLNIILLLIPTLIAFLILFFM